MALQDYRTTLDRSMQTNETTPSPRKPVPEPSPLSGSVLSDSQPDEINPPIQPSNEVDQDGIIYTIPLNQPPEKPKDSGFFIPTDNQQPPQ